MKRAGPPGSAARTAFTLIELLIVVLIIAILAAIAIPNFLEYQVRAKVSRIKADFRAMQTGMMAYRVDNDAFPPDNFPGQIKDVESLYYLTTPVAYISTVPESPYDERNRHDAQFKEYYEYWLGAFVDGRQNLSAGAIETGIFYRLTSIGPDNAAQYGNAGFSNMPIDIQQKSSAFINGLYDPTNGSASAGDILISNQGLYN